MRISDWSSDVCSSDLRIIALDREIRSHQRNFLRQRLDVYFPADVVENKRRAAFDDLKIEADMAANPAGLPAIDDAPDTFAGHTIVEGGVITHRRNRHGSNVLHSEQRRVGNECVSQFNNRWSPD